MKKKPLIHIAYAEDHYLIRAGITSLINALEGMHVTIEAENGSDLIEKIQKSRNKPDICILDLNMPKMNGFETLQVLKSKWPSIGVLILTVFDEEFHKIRMILSGANGYLLKNCHHEELRKAIFSIFNEGIYYPDVITKELFESAKNRELKFPNLTESELLILRYCCDGELSYSQIAEKIGTTQRSVEGIRDSLFRKFNTHSRVSLAMIAIRFGIVTIEFGALPYKSIFIKEKGI